jgi:carboxymethylenebutenolidase
VGERVVIETFAGRHSAYFAPGDGPPVVVLQEYWGVVPQICGVADRLAAEGFRVAVPDLYDGALTDDRERAAELMMAIDLDHATEVVESTVDWLIGEADGRGLAGCVGFCMGGGLALVLAAVSPVLDAAVVYYGAIPWPGIQPTWTASSASVQLHYASEDGWATAEYGRCVAEAVRAGGGSADFWLYEGAQHGFLDETRAESHDRSATAVAWERTVKFLARELA